MTESPTNHNTITIVVVTVCVLAGVCVCAEAACSVFKIPDMSGSLSSGFTHVTDTLVGALIALLINTRPQSTNPSTGPGDTNVAGDATLNVAPK